MAPRTGSRSVAVPDPSGPGAGTDSGTWAAAQLSGEEGSDSAAERGRETARPTSGAVTS
ncbi:hypothetical protein K373_06490 [Streptomyces sp. DvalAA-21]|nr:putative beta-N-acetylhexosaminidase [Streptomyces sp. SirexAA-E]PZX29926.1 hypothetical protein K373_06549 [Streptomyces sp. DvalAA-21]RAJ25075.1 hypothetical protein K351_06613 [Streptomyces sp. DpondAA-E10]RAJ39907.1 hypothetical protein K352_06388 [Streptomyces sp. DpondAA-A50]SCD30206.1 hypothetical protein GA0115235_100920 [Streptomyces sp. DpondAA-F4a]SCM06223.1 hypothetical protein SAMN04883147_107020 [Streptomyces sp. DpondAA-F4]